MSTHDLLLVLIPALVIVVLLVLFLPTRRSRTQSGPTADGSQLTNPVYSDDDRYWHGFLYYNPDDPNPFVPRRYGLGWTVNFGHPAGKLIAAGMAGILLLPTAPAIFDPGLAASGCHPNNCHPLTP
jgi:uncharacterized membrane protein